MISLVKLPVSIYLVQISLIFIYLHVQLLQKFILVAFTQDYFV